MRRLLAGQLDVPEYTSYVSAIACIYRVLEGALELHASHPSLSWIQLDELRRLPVVERDLESLGGCVSAGRAASAAYTAHLEDVSSREPALLAAHAYVRYLGDLAGGQLIARSLRAAHGPDFPVRSYEFAEPKRLRAEFRAGLDHAPLDADAMVAEANLSFALHEHMFALIPCEARDLA